MHAFLYATQELNKNPSKIRVVSVGCASALPDKIDNSAGLLDWASRLLTLSSPVKAHTMDYMLSNILSSKNKTDPFYKFEIRITEADKTALYKDHKTRHEKVHDMAASMIY